MRRRRIWSELLPPEELGAPATIALLKRYEIEPIVALPPAAQTPAMGRALGALARGGVGLGIWPLLEDHQGYWPSDDNAVAFCARVEAARQFAVRAGGRVHTVAVDLEPPVGVTRELLGGSPRERGAVVLRSLRGMRSTDRRARRRDAATCYAALAARLHRQQLDMIVAVVPPVVADMIGAGTFWGRFFRTPQGCEAWGAVSPMLYTSMMAKALPGGVAAARSVLFELARGLVWAIGASRASASVGLVGCGKFGDEPVFESPEQLRLDVAAARCAGVDDLALFSLEGVLHRGAPEQWLVPFTQAQAGRPADTAAGVATRMLLAFLRSRRKTRPTSEQHGGLGVR